MTTREVRFIEKILKQSPEVEWDWFCYNKNDQDELRIDVVGYTETEAIIETIMFGTENKTHSQTNFDIKEREGETRSSIGKEIIEGIASRYGAKVRLVENTFPTIKTHKR